MSEIHLHSLSQLSPLGKKIVDEELDILERIKARLQREAQAKPQEQENLDGQLIELRDAIVEAKEEDVASLISQMHQVAALNRSRGRGRDIPVDPKSPYFGHLRLREAKTAKIRDVLIGKHTLLDDGDGLSIVDWRNAPVSRLYYRYEEEDDYEEEFDERSLEGEIMIRRSLAIMDSELRRISAPQGTYVCTSQGQWRDAVGAAKPKLAGGVGVAVRVPRGQLGIHGDEDAPRADKHLQEITALIDKEQFALITQPDSGIVLIQGGAGSGKTTVALHRVAYLAYQDPKRFAPSKMLIVVFNDALVEYIRHVLPALGVEGVEVTTYRKWSIKLLRKINLPRWPQTYMDDTPEPVSRFKKHPVILKMLHDLLAEQVEAAEELLQKRLNNRAKKDSVLAIWRRYEKLPLMLRIQRTIRTLNEQKDESIPGVTRAAAETAMRVLKDQTSDVFADWLELMTHETRIREAIASQCQNEFTEHEIATITRWCADKAELEIRENDHMNSSVNHKHQDEESDEDEAALVSQSSAYRDKIGLDPEDDAIFLRLLQMKYGGLFVGQRRFEYEHVVIDEAQDLCPLEVRVLLDCVSSGKSVTIAGDRAQKMIFDNGFSDWPQLLKDAGLPHVEIQPLKITYRSTRQVMELSHYILGPLLQEEQLVAREGAPVGYYEFRDVGESVAFLGESLRSLMRREPTASVALLTRYPQQADLYYESLRIAEVPRLRRVNKQNFSFLPGIDVTDVRQVKGLEFDYVIVLDPTTQNYPEAVEARHLLHIAVTRAAFQLWLVCSGPTSKLIPPALMEDAESVVLSHS